MMEVETTSPNWIAMLDSVETRLAQMLAAAQARIEEVSLAVEPSHFEPPELEAVLAGHAAGLQQRLGLAESMLHQVEESLRVSEESARDHLFHLTNAARKWSEWPGSAIG